MDGYNPNDQSRLGKILLGGTTKMACEGPGYTHPSLIRISKKKGG